MKPAMSPVRWGNRWGSRVAIYNGVDAIGSWHRFSPPNESFILYSARSSVLTKLPFSALRYRRTFIGLFDADEQQLATRFRAEPPLREPWLWVAQAAVIRAVADADAAAGGRITNLWDFGFSWRGPAVEFRRLDVQLAEPLDGGDGIGDLHEQNRRRHDRAVERRRAFRLIDGGHDDW